ncbi:hypothetical protein PR202_gb03499 [Eleusine coracana subsp. coracana]|uniref:Enhancer of polycomb-like protein n=1 Tax=Eleusine coracana subsp. coracana TaxID=191504 RepID=A0AAV5E1Z6_ELECO|nr:hypothetical protein PR202_gb03499 [Eleusine coracana subsp. coracana]
MTPRSLSGPRLPCFGTLPLSPRRVYNETRGLDKVFDLFGLSSGYSRSPYRIVMQFSRHDCILGLQAYPASNKKNAQEIPTPQYDLVDTYERDYTCTFAQPATYIRGRGARTEIGEFIEYDLDNEDEDWLKNYNNEQKNIIPEMLEVLLFKLEMLDHKARERAGIIIPTIVGPIPVILQLNSAMEALQYLSFHYAVFEAVYSYWKSKVVTFFFLRESGGKSLFCGTCRCNIEKIMSNLLKGSACDQTPEEPPVRSAVIRRPENVKRGRGRGRPNLTWEESLKRDLKDWNVVKELAIDRSAWKLAIHVRRNLEQAKREEQKRETMEYEVHFRRLQMKYKHEALFLDGGITHSGLQQVSSQCGSSEDDYADSDDTIMEQPYRPPVAFGHRFTDILVTSSVRLKYELELKRKLHQTAQLFRRVSAMQDPDEPVMLFTRPLDPDKMDISRIRPPADPSIGSGATTLPFRCQGRIGRGGRIIFDRWNTLLQVPIGQQSHFLSLALLDALLSAKRNCRFQVPDVKKAEDASDLLLLSHN